MTKILALTSTRGRSGKDTLIEELLKAGYSVIRVSFADALKDGLATHMAWTGFTTEMLREEMDGPLKDTPQESLRVGNMIRTDYRTFLEDQGHSLTAPRSWRWHQQQFGNAYWRDHKGQPDIWLNKGLEKIGYALPANPDFIVVADMRQYNEYSALKSMGATTLRLLREWSIPEVDGAPFHITDIALAALAVDGVLVNRWGHQEALVTQLQEILKTHEDV